MSKEIDHEGTPQIVCPYCGYIDQDSWEIAGDDECGEADCGECGRSFYWSHYVRVTYTTRTKEAQP